ncbi:MAG: hypothetical protein JW934_20805 [Anaerolineae bacterium]|nr:hypothetical protein [Anaerolineae bacterium]
MSRAKKLFWVLTAAVIVMFLASYGPGSYAMPSFQQSEGTCAITSPVAGNLLSGQVIIRGTAKHPGFTGYQIGYAPDPNPTGEWKFFASGQSSVENGQLGVWNTTQLADGAYQLIMEVFRNDGNKDLCFVGTMRINNSAPTPTFTPLPLPTSANTPTPLPTATQTATVVIEQPPTSTPRPTPTYSAADNPTPTPQEGGFKLPFEMSSVRDWSCKGALLTLVIAIVVALYFIIRSAVATGVRKISQPKDVEGFHRRRPREY